MHGESDAIHGTGSKYYDHLIEWQHDYDEMVKAITGQEGDAPLFICQLSSFALIKHLHPKSDRPFEITLAQLRASINNPTIYLVTPKYHIPYSYKGHLTNTGSRWLGEKYGEVMWRVFGLGENWMPLQPAPNFPPYRDGNLIYINMHVPDPPMVVDTDIVGLRKNYGFVYSDSDGQTEIESVTIDDDTVVIELTQVP
ncbi:MAG: hypothetical protein GY869_02515, partial [Planctomycetes bacterium]|nr:hypothetical protein [Planctomycetota bacterium]